MGALTDFSKVTKDMLTFEVATYGESIKLTDTLSKARVRIFYKGMNRNRTYISEEFAQKLVDSLPYAPIKGIFNTDDMDFEDHGIDNTVGRIYGIVPENPNFAWEKHLDCDGVEREYATADVYLFTGLYPEAKLIPEKSQSMEIYKNTYKGEWRISDEDHAPYFYFTDGCLVGLQALGDDCEPCFEGAAFYTFYNHIKNSLDYFTKKIQEGDIMEKSTFRLSDSDKFDLIFCSLNPNYNRENDWKIDTYVIDVYDDYALCRNAADYSTFRQYYTKDDNSDTVTLGEKIAVKIVDVTESEALALEAMKNTSKEYEKDKANWETEKTTYESTITTLNTEKEALNSEKEKIEAEKIILENTVGEQSKTISEMETAKQNFEAEINSLQEFKKTIETEQKNSIIEEFSENLTDNKIQEFKSAMEKYSVDDFRKEVCVAAYEANKTFLTHKDDDALIYKNTGSEGSKYESGAVRLLRKNKQGGNK